MTRRELEKAAAKYRRTYDRLYIASQRAGSAEECMAIDAKLAAANREYEAAKAAHDAGGELPDGRTFVGDECTLDGKRAIVCGRLRDAATVATLPTGPSYEYAWPTVARVMTSQEGAFRS